MKPEHGEIFYDKYITLNSIIMITAIILWIVLGSLVGWYGSSLMRSKTRDPQRGVNMALGVNGAVTGGVIVSSLGHGNALTMNFYGFLMALLCAIILIYSFRILQK